VNVRVEDRLPGRETVVKADAMLKPSGFSPASNRSRTSPTSPFEASA